MEQPLKRAQVGVELGQDVGPCRLPLPLVDPAKAKAAAAHILAALTAEGCPPDDSALLSAKAGRL